MITVRKIFLRSWIRGFQHPDRLSPLVHREPSSYHEDRLLAQRRKGEENWIVDYEAMSGASVLRG
jgi:hypothetical protein